MFFVKDKFKFKKIASVLVVFMTVFCSWHVSAAEGDFIHAKGMGSNLSDSGASMTTDSSGNVYTTGTFYSTVDFDPGAGTAELVSGGNVDVFIFKLNSSGGFVWAKRVGGTGNDQVYSIDSDTSGNIYVTGHFQNTVDFDPGAGTTNLVSGGGDDIFVLKLDSSGNFVWAKQMGGAGTDRVASVAVDSSGNVYTTGLFYDPADFDPGVGTATLTSAGGSDVFISKLNSSGAFVWVKQLGGFLPDAGASIFVSADDNYIYTTGSFMSTVDFDPGAGTTNLTSAGAGDVYVSKMDSSGNLVWAKKMGGSASDESRGLAVDSTGNVYTTGFFGGTADFDPGAGTTNLTSAGDSDVFISKLNSSGDVVWAKRFGSTGFDIGTSIAVDSYNYVYSTGNFLSTVDFDPGAGTSNLTSAGGADGFILKLDSSGGFGYAKKVGGTGYDGLGGLIFDPSNNIYVTGGFLNTVDFDPGVGTSELYSNGQSDIFVLKLEGSLAPDTTPPTISITEPLDEAVVYGSTVTISATASDDTGVVGVQFKIDGVDVESEYASGPYQFDWDSTTVADGSYTIAAVARDSAGNRATSTIMVTVQQLEPIGIANCTQLQAMSDILEADYFLLNNIDCTGFDPEENGKGFIPVGNSETPFTGSFNGGGYSITGLTINRPEENNVGLFGYVSGGTFEIVTLSGSIEGYGATGSLIGYSATNELTIGSVTSSASVTGHSSQVGGLVGYSHGAVGITNGHYTGNIIIEDEGESDVEGIGGIIGGSGSVGLVVSSTVTGDMSISSDSYSYSVGGIAGYVYDTTSLESVSFSGNISVSSGQGVQSIGGLVGYSSDGGEISDSAMTGDITVDAGAFIQNGVGGLLGYDEGGFDINNSYMTGDITATAGSYVTYGIGGLVGYFYSGSNVSFSYMSGDIHVLASDYISYGVGGLVGYNSSNNTYLNSFFNGNIYATSTTDNVSGVAGILGWNDGNSVEFWNQYAAGRITVSAGGAADGIGGIVGTTETEGYVAVSDSFASIAISVASVDLSTNIGALLGHNNEGGTLTNNFYDKTVSTVSFCTGMDDPDPAECTAVEDNAVYFKGNNINAPLNAWTFPTHWTVVEGKYPMLTDLPSPYVEEEVEEEPAPVVPPAPIVNTPTPVVAAPIGPQGGSSPSSAPVPVVLLPQQANQQVPIVKQTSNSILVGLPPIRIVQSSGRRSTDVLIVQKILNLDPATQVSKTGAGSPGRETDFFGSATRAAVGKFQLKYKIVKSNRDAGYGVVGPKTKAVMNELLKKSQ